MPIRSVATSGVPVRETTWVTSGNLSKVFSIRSVVLTDSLRLMLGGRRPEPRYPPHRAGE